MHAISSYRGNRPTNKHSHKSTNRQDRLHFTALLATLSAHCNKYRVWPNEVGGWSQHHCTMFYSNYGSISCRSWNTQSKNVVTLKSGSEVTQLRSLKVVPFDRLSEYGFLLVFYSKFVPRTHRFWDIQLQKCHDLENLVIGTSRSLEMSPFDRAHATSYWCSIVTLSLRPAIFEIFDL